MTTPVEKLQSFLFQKKLDAILVSSLSNIIYFTNYSRFSQDEREAFLFITQKKQYILTDTRYSQAVKNLIPNFQLIEISRKLPATEALKEIIQKHKIKKIGFEGHDLSHLEYKKISKALGKITHIYIDHLRAIKNPKEISQIEEACHLGDKAFTHILKKLRSGISEKEIVCELEYFIKKQGADISFPPIIAFGKNSAAPHHVPTNNKLTNNQIVLMDFGTKLNNYCSDMTRTIFFGRPSSKQKKMYKTILESQQKAIEALHKSNKASDIDKAAREYIISQGYPTIPHSLGHGIGIEVHEAPRLYPTSADILKEGMIFSIEPGIYIPDFGGIRIEDLVVIEKSGPRLLTHSPKEIIEL